MPSWLPSIPYPAPDQPGYWDPVTATLNFCEEDYYVTVYSAELVNAITNLTFTYLAAKGVRNCLQNGHDTIFLIAYAAYAIVGFGSFLFHSTLMYPMQLLDELSMIYSTCLMVYASFSHSRSNRFKLSLAVSLVALAVFITLYYHFLQDPRFHQNAYALLTSVVVFRSMFIMETKLRPALRRIDESTMRQEHNASPPHTEGSQDRKDSRILTQMWILVAYGLLIFLGGFGVWTLDNIHCAKLRRWRRVVGLPWGILLEGHGWWHLMTGIGAYCYLVWGIWLRHCLNKRQAEFKLVWPSFFVMPEIVRVGRQTDNSAASVSEAVKKGK